jgi:hypothetical protein
MILYLYISNIHNIAQTLHFQFLGMLQLSLFSDAADSLGLAYQSLNTFILYYLTSISHYHRIRDSSNTNTCCSPGKANQTKHAPDCFMQNSCDFLARIVVCSVKL